MSSGQKAWAEDLEEERQAEHYKRLENLGFCVIANAVDEMSEDIKQLEAMMVSLPRSGWGCLDALKKNLRKLK